MSDDDRFRAEELIKILTSKVIGQASAFRHIVPYFEMHRAGLASEGRPLGVFLLLGPTGTGKTHTVEALAEVLHGSRRKYLRVDCGEYQLDHEVARLVGAPPGYLGHRETKPVLSQEALRAATTPDCDVSLILFDEIEKAAPSLTRLLLGVLDKATLQMGDNTSVDFEKSLIFLTSNLGAREMQREMRPTFGFDQGERTAESDLAGKLESIAMAAVRKKFSPEFINRIDAIVTYQPLSSDSLAKILDLQIEELRQHVQTKLGPRSFDVEVLPAAARLLLKEGTSEEFGARELKRTVYRDLTQPLATLVAQNNVPPGSRVSLGVDESGEKLAISITEGKAPALPATSPQVLIVDDNTDLLRFLATIMADSGWEIITAESSLEAREKTLGKAVDAALLDYMLPDQNGVELGLLLKAKLPSIEILIMTGMSVPDKDEEVCRRNGFPLIQKPFLVDDVLDPIRRRLLGPRNNVRKAT
jgi:ATP-dependent Clp protease ATP-binding subunit ClpA/ActR/RegA family two-component response regulator